MIRGVSALGAGATGGQRRARMATIALAVVAVVAVVAVSPSVARAASLTTSLSGTVRASWQGDPARGCAAVGLCGVVGSASAGGDAEVFSGFSTESGGPGVGILFVGLGGGTVRVIRADGATPGICVDQLSSFGDTGLALVQARGGVRVTDSLPASNPQASQLGLLSAGRCAGPLASDLGGLLPTVFVSSARLRRGVTVPLSDDRSFVAGPFSGTLRAALRLFISTAPNAQPTGLALVSTRSASRERRVVQEVADVSRRFTIAASAGALQTSFTGDPAPACVELDACDVSGTSALGDVSGIVELEGAGALPRAAGSSTTAALRLYESGRLALGLSAGANTSASVTEVADRPGAAACRDSTTVPFSFGGGDAAEGGTSFSRLQTANPSAIGSAAGLSIDVSAASAVFGSGVDLLRTRCAGPSESDLFPSVFADLEGGEGLNLAGASATAGELLSGGPVTLSFLSAASSDDGIYTLGERGPLALTLVPDGPPRVSVRREVVP